LKDKHSIKEAKKRARSLASLIGYFDGLRSEVVVDPERVLKLTKEVGGDKRYWKQFSKEASKAIDKLRRSTKIKRMIRAARILELVTMVYFMIVSILALTVRQNISVPKQIQPIFILLSYPSIIFLLCLASFTLLVLSLTRYEIKKQVGEGIRVEKIAKQRLKEAAQYYINVLTREIRRYKLNADDYKIKLWNTDYKGVKIVGEPNVFRSHYLAVIDVKHRNKI